MDNLVVLHTGQALNLLWVLRLLGLMRDQLLQVLLGLMQLSLEVVDVALGGSQLILSMLQLGAGIVEVIGLEVTAAISPHQLIV
jgi:hypothetical protein